MSIGCHGGGAITLPSAPPSEACRARGPPPPPSKWTLPGPAGLAMECLGGQDTHARTPSAFLYMAQTSGNLIGKMTKRDGLLRSSGSSSTSCEKRMRHGNGQEGEASQPRGSGRCTNPPAARSAPPRGRPALWGRRVATPYGTSGFVWFSRQTKRIPLPYRKAVLLRRLEISSKGKGYVRINVLFKWRKRRLFNFPEGRV